MVIDIRPVIFPATRVRGRNRPTASGRFQMMRHVAPPGQRVLQAANLMVQFAVDLLVEDGLYFAPFDAHPTQRGQLALTGDTWLDWVRRFVACLAEEDLAPARIRTGPGRSTRN